MDGWCEVLDSKTLATIVRSRPSAGAAIVVAWHPSDDRIASASTDGIVAVWDVTTGEALLDFEVDKDVHQLNWSPNGQRLAARMSSGEIMIWDASEGYRRSASNTLSEHRRRREKASPQTQNEQSLPAQGVQTDNAHFRPST
jgi:WD40 repeat protein